MPEEYDPFWDSHKDREAAKRPRNVWDAVQTIAFWLAIVTIVWLLCGTPGLS